MRRIWWFFSGFFIGMGVFATAAVVLMEPGTRRQLLEYGEHAVERVGEAVSAGLEAAREREAELEQELGKEPEHEGFGGQERPDYVV